MTLAAGTRIGQFEIVAPIGSGGMGEVYRALDTTLGRDVALKVLPPAFANDRDRMERMRREAQVLAALNHPDIAAIYGVEGHALAMELVEGETIRGPLPLETALQYARQIAEALEHAHEKGIIHRDLKPANVKVTAEGVVKVLDFGLAKIVDDPSASADTSNSPTLTMRATEAGLILGTAAYMAPEQARGTAVDRRADIWAFGLVLYEMLAGQRLFAGETVSDTLAAVLKGDIDLSALPADTPPAIRTLLRRCLDRDRKRRLQAIGEARIVIDDVLSGSAREAPEHSMARAAYRRWPWIAATAMLAAWLLVSLPIVIGHFREAPQNAPTVEVDLAPPAGIGNPNFFAGPIVSPDGRHVALAGEEGMFVREMGSSHVIAIGATQRTGGAFWSPDSRFVAYFSGSPRLLVRAPLGGGAPQVVAELPFNASGAAWGPDGTIVVGQQRGPLYRIPADGGAPTVLTALDPSRGDRAHFVAAILRDGRVIYLAEATSAQSCATDPCPDLNNVHVLGAGSTKGAPLVEGVSTATYAQTADGSAALLFVRANELWAQRFNAQLTALSGEPVRVAVEVDGQRGVSASMNGVLAYRAATRQAMFELVWLDRRGARLGTVGEVAAYTNPALSRDERWLAVSRTDPATRMRDIWVADLVRKTTSRLTTGTRDEMNPVWSPDGQTVIFSSAEDDPSVRNIYRKPASGVGEAEVVLRTDTSQKNVEDWSSDGQFVIYNADSRDIWRLRLDGKGGPEALLESQFTEDQGSLSPDGRWLAYRSFESGRAEVYVQTFPPGARRWQLSNAGGSDPQWRRDGRELFYLAGDQLMSVPITVRDGAIDAGLPQPLFRVSVEQANRRNHYLVADNGQRFLVVQPVDDSAPLRLVSVVNWIMPASE